MVEPSLIVNLIELKIVFVPIFNQCFFDDFQCFFALVILFI